ncbi:MAG: nuclear transport factor 2 family protein [Actinomycetota bacterium]|nr:nuclear transport factor 2 family protein [Actinomycetota bacterium]
MSQDDPRAGDPAQAVVDELASHLAEVFDTVPGGVYLYLDPSHKVCNQRLAEMLGTTVEEWRALDNFRDTFVAVTDRQSYCDTYERVVHGLDWPESYRFRAVRKDGTAFDAEATIVPLTFGGRKLAYHFVRPVQHHDGEAPEPEQTVRRFQDAWNRHDVDEVMALMTDDCVFETTWPPPDGERVEGHFALRTFWERFFAQSPQATIDIEELFACGDRATMRWRYHWGGEPGQGGHVRGVDMYRVRHGKVAEKFSYVKG